MQHDPKHGRLDLHWQLHEYYVTPLFTQSARVPVYQQRAPSLCSAQKFFFRGIFLSSATTVLCHAVLSWFSLMQRCVLRNLFLM